MRPARPRLSSIGVKLALAYLVPTAALWGILMFFTQRAAREELDRELGKRLAGIAAGAAAQVRGAYLVDPKTNEPKILPGDEEQRAYKNTRRKLEIAREATGVARLYVFRPDLTMLVDTGEAPIGEKQYQLELDSTEIQRMLGERVAVSSTTFRGSDGSFYKAGYAPVTASEEDETVVAGIAAEAPAEYFTRLEVLRRNLGTYAAATLALYVLLSILVAALLVRPIRKLTAAAERIGQGELSARVPQGGRDEIGFLARTLDEMREGLRQRSERLQMMLAGIAHEVRNPLGGIELYAGILREELDGDEKQAHVKKIEREVAHLKNVVNDFLEYARRPRPELKPVELQPLLEEIAEVSAADAERAQVTLVAAAAPAGLRVLADSTQLRRALLNLVRNAVQATPAGGRVELAAARAGDFARVVISDTGKGIDAAVKEKIFQPFFTTKEKGTGLGLAFVREIVLDHGGMLEVDSEVGRGTSFTVSIPLPGA